mmetsp:Transcript_6943/g.10802  ORF Transcript_6943/g.10802 Transcript_6943/m.10802 type:complete len:141 (+) Transcript_6943:2420-2842(+)
MVAIRGDDSTCQCVEDNVINRPPYRSMRKVGLHVQSCDDIVLDIHRRHCEPILKRISPLNIDLFPFRSLLPRRHIWVSVYTQRKMENLADKACPKEGLKHRQNHNSSSVGITPGSGPSLDPKVTNTKERKNHLQQDCPWH